MLYNIYCMLYNVYFGLKFIYYKDKCLCLKHYDNFFVWKKLENCRCADSDTKKWQWEEWYWRSGVSPDRASVRVLQPGHGYNTLSGMTWWISFPTNLMLCFTKYSFYDLWIVMSDSPVNYFPVQKLSAKNDLHNFCLYLFS